MPSTAMAAWATHSIGVRLVGDGDQLILSSGVVFRSLTRRSFARVNSAFASLIVCLAISLSSVCICILLRTVVLDYWIDTIHKWAFGANQAVSPRNLPGDRRGPHRASDRSQ